MEAAGALSAVLGLSSGAADTLRHWPYRHLSPGLLLEPGTGEVLTTV